MSNCLEECWITTEITGKNGGRGNSSLGIITFAKHFGKMHSASDFLFVCFFSVSTEG